MFNSLSCKPGSSKQSETQKEFLARKLIFGYLSYDELARTRLVSKDFNVEASAILTSGFKEFSQQLNKEKSFVKKALPRRESDRKKHDLYPYSELVSSLETRRDLLEMTYSKFIEKDMVCFIPGKVLDEGFRILRMMRRDKYRRIVSHIELLKEFRDLSSMAMDHFEEYIAPALRKKRDDMFQALFKRPVPFFEPIFPSSPLPIPDSVLAVSNQVNELISIVKKQATQIKILEESERQTKLFLKNFADFVGYSGPPELFCVPSVTQAKLINKDPDFKLTDLNKIKQKPICSTETLECSQKPEDMIKQEIRRSERNKKRKYPNCLEDAPKKKIKEKL